MFFGDKFQKSKKLVAYLSRLLKWMHKRQGMKRNEKTRGTLFYLNAVDLESRAT